MVIPYIAAQNIIDNNSLVLDKKKVNYDRLTIKSSISFLEL